MTVHPAPATRMSAEEFYERFADDDLNKQTELIGGEVFYVSPARLTPDFVISNILHLLDTYVRAHRLGRFTLGSGGFKLNVPRRRGDTVRAPDIGFVSAARMRAVIGGDRGFGRGAPDFAVEVRSPGQSTAEIHLRRDDLFADGTRLLWDVDPKRRTVVIHQPDAEPHILSEHDTIDGGDVVPGFTAPVSEVFVDPLAGLDDPG